MGRGTDQLGILKDNRARLDNIDLDFDTLNSAIESLNSVINRLNTYVSGAYESDGFFNVQDTARTSEVIDLYIHKDLNNLTLTEDSSLNATGIYVSSMLAATGNTLCLKEGSHFYQGQIISHSTNRIVLDSPLDYAFTTSSLAHSAEHDMAVNGATTTQIYHINPPSGSIWYITRIIFHIEDNVAMDDGLFGGVDKLNKGVVLRVVNGVTKNIFNIKSNGDFAERCYDRTYESKPPAGTGYAMTVRRSFGGEDKNGVIIALDGSTGDSFQILIQDDLSAISHFHAICQGRIKSL